MNSKTKEIIATYVVDKERYEISENYFSLEELQKKRSDKKFIGIQISLINGLPVGEPNRASVWAIYE